jgi:azurin
MYNIKIPLVLVFITFTSYISAQEPSEMAKKEAVYYEIVDVPIPKDVVLEVGGLTLTDDDKLGVTTRRGELWVIDKPYSQKPIYSRFAHGLHEALGVKYRDNSFYLTQRGELSRLFDHDGDGKADEYKTIYSWPLSGNYHDYAYGPKFTENGDMLVTLNLSWVNHGASLVKWRGWMLKITPEGDMEPIATGLRSPSGFNINKDGDVFYTENQGDWVGSGRMTHLEKGDVAGNPEGLRWSSDPLSPIDLKQSDIDDELGLTLYEYSKKIPALKAPAVWFPHTILGIATSDILYETTGNKFGPFDGQMLIGDQGHSKITRVFMEKINGVYQGAAFAFREGFSSGVLRLLWGSDSSMFVGMTSRGWASTGKKSFGLQRLKWTGKTPFEIKTMKAQNDGFKLEFTKPINKKLAADVATYNMTSFTYNYHHEYGSDIIDRQTAMVHEAIVSEDGLTVILKIHGMRLGYIHQLEIPSLKSTSGDLLLHNTGYYTLNEVPGGKLNSPSMTMVAKSDKKVVQPKRVSKMPESWNNKIDEKLDIGTKPGLKYDVEEVRVKSGSKIALTFNNNDDMLHNLVITEKGIESVDEVGKLALSLGLEGADYNYVPDTDLVLYHTGILKPISTETIYVTMPETPGEYWIVCTFPGHSAVMRAKLIVE